MRSRHPSIGLLCGVLIISGSIGCAVNTSISRRSGAADTGNAVPERLISIARVFESQGHLKQADLTYRRALRRFPSSEQAREGIARIASMNETRTFRAPATGVTAAPEEPLVALGTSPGGQLSSVTPQSKLYPVTIEQSIGVSQFDSRTSPSLAVETNTQKLDAAPTESVGPSVHSPGTAHLTLVSSEDVSGAESDSASDDSPAFGAAVSQIDPAAEHLEALLKVLASDSDAERRALAAAVLADAPADNSRVDSALEENCTDEDATVAAIVGDSLLVRGIVNDASVQTLFGLAEHPNSEVRSQVTTSMRMLVGTSWESDAVLFLTDRLDDSDPAVRSMAALTLGDFDGDSGVILERLVDRYNVEADSAVRSSLELAAERIGTLPVDEQSRESDGN